MKLPLSKSFLLGLTAAFLLAGCTAEANQESTPMNHANMDHASHANTGNDDLTKTSSMTETSDGKKIINIEAKKIHWMYNQQKMDTALSYNGKVPVEETRVQEGDRVVVKFKNSLPDPSAIHFHGNSVPFLFPMKWTGFQA